jgi:hypothetical protein
MFIHVLVTFLVVTAPLGCQQDRVSLYARVSSNKSYPLSSLHIMFILQPIKKSFTVSFLQFRGSLSIVEDEDDLQVVNVVQYPQHVYKMEVLSSSPPS